MRIALRWSAGCVCLSGVPAPASESVAKLPAPGDYAEMQGAVKMVPALLRRQGHLLDASQRAVLGEIDRQIPEIESRTKEPASIADWGSKSSSETPRAAGMRMRKRRARACHRRGGRSGW